MMAKKTYYDAVKEALDDQPALANCSLTDAEIEAEIAEISQKLTGPLSNVERIECIADRSELRATLKARHAS